MQLAARTRYIINDDDRFPRCWTSQRLRPSLTTLPNKPASVGSLFFGSPDSVIPSETDAQMQDYRDRSVCLFMYGNRSVPGIKDMDDGQAIHRWISRNGNVFCRASDPLTPSKPIKTDRTSHLCIRPTGTYHVWCSLYIP